MAEMEPHVFMPDAATMHRCKYTNGELEVCGRTLEEHYDSGVPTPAELAAMEADKVLGAPKKPLRVIQQELLEDFFQEHIVGSNINFQSTPGIKLAIGMAWQAAWDAALRNQQCEGICWPFTENNRCVLLRHTSGKHKDAQGREFV